MGWLDGWSYRKSVTLTRASGAVTNYQMKLLLGESSGATGEDVDAGGLCLSSFNDIRFTAADGTTVLDYWIESVSGATPNQLATIWIEFDSVGTSATTFYMYYGNAGAAAYSNGPNTFIQYHGAASASFHDSNVTPTTGGLRYRARAKASSASNTLIGLQDNATVATGDGLLIQYYSPGDLRYYYQGNNGTYSAVTEAGHLATSTYYNVEINYIFGSGGHGYVDGNEIAAGHTNNLPDAAMGLFFYSAGGSADQLWSFVGQYLATEPAWGAWGAQEDVPVATGNRRRRTIICGGSR